MSTYTRLRESFDVNWTTILVGWKGLGGLSPWPDRWEEFPPLLTFKEVADYALERLESSNAGREQDATTELVSLNLGEERRGAILSLLAPLLDMDGGDPVTELRKWRLILLEQKLEHLPEDPLYALTELTEFWNEFHFPPDGPHEAQGVGNSISPADYYTQENRDRLLLRHRDWIKSEAESIKKASGSRVV